MDDPQANAAKSRIPRFSLRTLLILMALAGSGYALWHNWGPWGHLSTISVPLPDEKAPSHSQWLTFESEIRFSPDGEKLLALVFNMLVKNGDLRNLDLNGPEHVDIDRLCLWEVAQPKLLLTKRMPPYIVPYALMPIAISEDGTIVVVEDKSTELPAGTTVYSPHNPDSPSRSLPFFGWHYTVQNTRRAQWTKSERIEVQQLRRPLAWYGVFWLPEFYAVALFATLLAWSAWKDVRAFGRQMAP